MNSNLDHYHFLSIDLFLSRWQASNLLPSGYKSVARPHELHRLMCRPLAFCRVGDPRCFFVDLHRGNRSTRDSIKPHGDRRCRRCGLRCRGAFHGGEDNVACQGRLWVLYVSPGRSSRTFFVGASVLAQTADIVIVWPKSDSETSWWSKVFFQNLRIKKGKS